MRLTEWQQREAEKLALQYMIPLGRAMEIVADVAELVAKGELEPSTGWTRDS